MTRVYVIGVGGTGSNLLKEFARYLSRSNKQNDIELTIIDGDMVEEKNLDRQWFSEDMIGIHKSEAMALTLQDIFGINICYHTNYLTSLQEMKEIFGMGATQEDAPIIISCVDNHHVRKLLHELYEQAANLYIIDSANEFSSGEVVVSMKIEHVPVYPDRSYYFPEILEDSKPVTEMGCEELNNASPQHLITNLYAANICFAQLLAILDGNLTTGGIYYFDALSSTCKKGDRKNA